MDTDRQQIRLPRLAYTLRNALTIAKARAQIAARRVRWLDAPSRDGLAADLALIDAAADRAAAVVRELEDATPGPPHDDGLGLRPRRRLGAGRGGPTP